MSNQKRDLPRSPQEVGHHLLEYLGKGDIEAALSLYEDEAAFASRDGGASFGLNQIRAALAEFTALQPTIVMSQPKVIQTGDIALMNSQWLLHGTGPDGNPITMGGHGSDVMRRQSDGTWKFLIDNAWVIQA